VDLIAPDLLGHPAKSARVGRALSLDRT